MNDTVYGERNMRTPTLNTTLLVVVSVAISLGMAQTPLESKELAVETKESAIESKGTSAVQSKETAAVKSGGTAAVDSKAPRPSCCSSTQKTDDAALPEEYFNVADDAFNIPEDGCDPIRFQQAKYLIGTGREFIKIAKPLHERMQEQILLAKTLKGRADTLMNQMPAVGSPKLQGAALKAAMGDYTKSLQAFVNNAEKYRLNLRTFRDTIGECQRAQADYDRQRNLYDLHCDQFHVQGLSEIEAPHICGQLDLTQSEAGHIAGELRADEQRLQAAMAEANINSELLGEARRLAAPNINNATTQAVRMQEEEKLAKEFGRLREEYEFLNIQAKVLGVDKRKEAGKMIHSVSGKVVNNR